MTTEYMEGHVAEVEDAIAQHVVDKHLNLSKEQIQETLNEHYSMLENGRKLDMLVDDYFGPPVVDIDGEVERTGGMKAANAKNWKDQKAFNVDQKAFKEKVEEQLDNGGLNAKVTLSRKQLTGIGLALAPVLAASINVLFG
jgi:hypothetical protein